MNRLNRTQKILCIMLLIFLAGLVPVFLWSTKTAASREDEKNQIAVSFSQNSGFYDHQIEIMLTAPQEGEIYYTLDGSFPSRDNGNAAQYDAADGGIVLPCYVKEKVYNVKAVFYAADGEESEVSAETYIIGKQIDDRYDMNVLSIFGDPADLTEETGILEMNNRSTRGQESEREIRITLFDSNGNTLLNQGCGIRIFGAATRYKNQPSLKLYARSEYDEQNEFSAVLFQDYDVNNALINNCKRAIIRNGGDDNGYAHLRSEFASRLSKDMGYPDALAASPVCVYINGQYYGTYWMEETFDESYFRRKYGDYEGRMIVLEDNIGYSEPLETDDEILGEMKEEYNVLYPVLAALDLSEESNWEYLNTVIDVDNFLQYMAIQNYFNNEDAMVNNFKVYRYYSMNEDYREGTVFDGRYRFLLYDLDQTLGYGAYDKPGAEPEVLTTANRVNYHIFYNDLFSHIVQTSAGRDTYIKYYLAMVNYYCEPERAEAVLKEMHESHAAELRTQYAETHFMENNMETPENIDYSHVIRSLEVISDYLEKRPDWALVDLEEAFGLTSKYTLMLDNPGEAYIQADHVRFADASYTGTYYSEVPAVLEARPKCGDKFDYWLVDGVEYDEPYLLITGDMLKDDTLFVECVTSKDPDAGLFITAVKSRGGSDYIQLTNYGQKTEDIASYTLGDDPDRGIVSSLPSMNLAPGDTITVYCKNYTGAEAIGQPEVNFNIKAGETVYLYKDRQIQQVYVPKLGTKDGVYRMEPHSGIFYERME